MRGIIASVGSGDAGSAMRLLKSDATQTECVGDHRYGAEGHRGTGENGTEKQAEKWVENSGGDGNAKRVIGERKEEILANIAHGRTTESTSAGDTDKIAFEKRDSGAFNSDVCSCAQRDSDIGGGESRGVVDPVAGHRDNVPLRFQPIYN